MKTTDEVLEKDLERLRETNELFAVDAERRDLIGPVVDDANLVVFGGVSSYWSRAVVLNLRLSDGTLEELGF